MAFLEAPRHLGVHIRVLREGASFSSPDSGNAAVDDKPDRSESTLIDLGDIDGASIDSASEILESFGVNTATGGVERAGKKEYKQRMDVTFKLQNTTAFALEMIFKSSALTTSSTSITPFSGGNFRGWFFLDFYDQDVDGAEPFLEVDLWCHSRMNSAIDLSADYAAPEIMLSILKSALNSAVPRQIA